MNGSYNHLNAFSRTLSTRTGETYAPQYLTTEMYQSIISGSVGNESGRPAWVVEMAWEAAITKTIK